MAITRRKFTSGSLALIASTHTAFARADKKLKILVVDGINNHTWKVATAALREILTDTGLFTVAVSTSPPAEAPATAWDSWRPDFAPYDAVINNFNGGFNPKVSCGRDPSKRPSKVRKQRRRPGQLPRRQQRLHPWPEYNQMIGLLWRPASFGPSIHIGDDDDHRRPSGRRKRTNHPPRTSTSRSTCATPTTPSRATCHASGFIPSSS